MPADWRRARALVLALGWNATAYQILNPGFRHWFAAGGDGVVGYVTHAGIRVVAGAPVCSADRLAAIADEFAADARRAGESVCYFGAGARLEEVFASRGGHALVRLGAAPVWDPREWPAIVERRASLRAQLHRARNKGVVQSEWTASRASGDAGVRACLAEWLARRGLPPLHFLVEPDTLNRLDDRRIFVAERDGRVVAFLVASPVPARNGWLVEQLVRGAGAPNGSAELLVDAAMRAMGGAGARYATLGLSPLSMRSGGVQTPAPYWLAAVLRWVRAHGRRFYNFEGLDAFKAKFAPGHWEPIYAIGARPRFRIREFHAIAGAFGRGSPVALIGRALGAAALQEIRGHR